MLLRQNTLAGIAAGEITLAFRRWKRPTVKAGGTLITSAGQLAIESVDVVDPAGITKGEAVAAGFTDVGALRASLDRRSGGDVYKVQLSLAGPDPRVALRARIPDVEESRVILAKLDRMDSRSKSGAWTELTLAIIAERPGVRAGDLAEAVGLEKAAFKLNVRKLKALGLTESLKVGYRLSPRGEAIRNMRETS